MAVKELGRRYLSQSYTSLRQALDSSSLVMDYLRYELQGEKQEVFAVLCLDAELHKLDFKKLFFGSLQHCAISINQLLRHIMFAHKPEFETAILIKESAFYQDQIERHYVNPLVEEIGRASCRERVCLYV